MIRVHVICEGQTEENFVKEILQTSFLNREIELRPALVGDTDHKGGNLTYDRLLRDIKKRLLGDRKSFCTTLFDFYGLPTSFPGWAEAENFADVEAKFTRFIAGWTDRMRSDLDENALARFIPYIQMHEYEGLLFSAPDDFAEGIGRPGLAPGFHAIRNEFSSPEEINDSPQTAPSKRIKQLCQKYDKVRDGVLAAEKIGLEIMRRECMLFHRWLEKLESLAPEISGREES